MTEPPHGDPGVLTNEGGLLDTETLTWTPIEIAGAPTARARASVAVAGDRVAVWGGALDYPSLGGSCGSNCNLASDGGLYDPSTREWELITAEGAPLSRMSATAYVADELLVVWGGRTVTGSLKDGGLYDLTSGTWAPIDLALDTLGINESENGYASLEPPFLVIVGPAEAGIYDPRTDTMTLADSTHGQPLATGGLRRLGSLTMSWDGSETEGHLWRIDAAAGRWRAASMPVEGQPLANAVVIWTGTRVIAWGGFTTERDPDGLTGCENVPPGVGCDPVVPMRRI
jgi:hypothetical protein